jgi:hypothetical protein
MKRHTDKVKKLPQTLFYLSLFHFSQPRYLFRTAIKWNNWVSMNHIYNLYHSQVSTGLFVMALEQILHLTKVVLFSRCLLFVKGILPLWEQTEHWAFHHLEDDLCTACKSQAIPYLSLRPQNFGLTLKLLLMVWYIQEERKGSRIYCIPMMSQAHLVHVFADNFLKGVHLQKQLYNLYKTNST